MSEVECSVCGLNGEPPASCDICHGNAPVAPRAYTLSDQRAGRAPKEDRYGHDGGLAPKPPSGVVGGAVNHPGNRP